MNKSPRTVGFIEGNGFPLKAVKILPNEPCYCGSGLKFKKCHGLSQSGTRYFYSKLNEKQEAEKRDRIEAAEREKEKQKDLQAID